MTDNQARAPARGFKNRVVAGLVLLVPVWLTFLVIQFVFTILRDASLWAIEWYLRTPAGAAALEKWGIMHDPEKGLASLPLWMQWGLACLAVGVTIVALYLLGGATANAAGRYGMAALEALLGRVPILKTIYQGSKQVLQTFAGENKKPFQRVISVPFPTDQIRSIAFVTGTSVDSATGEPLYIVMLANPMTGFIFVVKKSEAVELDWSVEDALKMMMSGGMIAPPQMPFTPQ